MASTFLIENVPVVEGHALGRPVSVLRDTGSNTVIVRRDVGADDHVNGRMRKIVLLDGSIKNPPQATIQVDTPYLVGEVTALCMTNTTHDIVLGNLPGVRAPNVPDPCWVSTSCTDGEVTGCLNGIRPPDTLARIAAVAKAMNEDSIIF
ncbi:hypothetical protein HPB48_018544 [Haemaphysalis longicornis]|uniref:Uncharacterized protein n=1 Tax=Haemaphysalis longicornis TaxID=44386 RepID=A0A9J6GGS8_HAELO|nr:hypothetical protein HPB48_018544 [Haemaphysalis longicornis]